jgi:hypothetical protein
VVALLALGASGYYLTRSSLSGPATVDAVGFYSTDDGKSFFAAPLANLPPWDSGGKPAYTAMVYSCDDGKTRFVAYLQRYTPDAKARIQRQMEDNHSGKTHNPVSIAPADVEVKKPGSENRWVSSADPAAAQIKTVTCLNGGIPVPQQP